VLTTGPGGTGRAKPDGFTLIELMVVVLIMGILMAIAIPTFLSTRAGANDSSAKSNVYNAFVNEKAYYSSNGAFVDLTGGNGAGSQAALLDPTLPWSGSGSVAAGQVTAIAGTTSGGANQFDPVATAGGTGQAVLIEALSKSGDCLYVFDQENGGTVSVLGYAESDNAAGCANAATNVDAPSTSPLVSAGNAGSNIITGTSIGAGNWYASW